MTGETTPSPDLRGHRILIVEDDALLAMNLEDMLCEVGAEVVGPAGTLSSATMMAVTNAGISAAVLDVRLYGGAEVWPVARLLAGNKVPLVFCTGNFDRTNLPAEWSGRPVLTKPATADHIIAILAELLAH